MPKIFKLKERGSGETLYPETTTGQVYGPDGRNLRDDILPGLQGKLSTSDDLSLSDANQLSLTAMAKKRLFIDMWNQACGKYGTYNTETGFFELNGLTDITYEQALKIYYHGAIDSAYCQGRYTDAHIRTNLPFATTLTGAGGADNGYYCDLLFTGSEIEVAWVINRFRMHLSLSNYNVMFNAPKLRKIIGNVDLFFQTSSKSTSNSPMFGPALEDVQIWNINQNFYLGNCPRITLESFSYMIQYASNNKAITIEVHPDIYAKLTDETNTEWHKVLTDAIAKDITFETV